MGLPTAFGSLSKQRWREIFDATKVTWHIEGMNLSEISIDAGFFFLNCRDGSSRKNLNRIYILQRNEDSFSPERKVEFISYF